MTENTNQEASGKPNYELNAASTQATSSSTEKRLEDKTVVSYRSEELESYKINRPKRDVIYAKIFKQEEPQKPCLTPEETKTTE